MRDYLSTHIGLKASRTLYYAIGELAGSLGMPLNQYVTLNFALTDIPADKAVDAFRALRNLFIKWARRPRMGAGPAFTPTFAYAFENARDKKPVMSLGADHNLHVHWLVHVPPQRQTEFGMVLYEWLDSLCTRPSAKGAIDLAPTVLQTKSLRGYLLKGSAPEWCEHFGASPSEQGLVLGRRTGTSRNLGPAARVEHDRRRGIRRRAA